MLFPSESNIKDSMRQNDRGHKVEVDGFGICVNEYGYPGGGGDDTIISRKLLKNSPDPTIPTNIWITFPVCSKAWTLTTSTLTFSTMATPKSVLATLGTSNEQVNVSSK